MFPIENLSHDKTLPGYQTQLIPLLSICEGTRNATTTRKRAYYVATIFRKCRCHEWGMAGLTWNNYFRMWVWHEARSHAITITTGLQQLFTNVATCLEAHDAVNFDRYGFVAAAGDLPSCQGMSEQKECNRMHGLKWQAKSDGLQKLHPHWKSIKPYEVIYLHCYTVINSGYFRTANVIPHQPTTSPLGVALALVINNTKHTTRIF